MDPKLAEWIALAERALQEGYDPAQVDRKISQLSGGKIPTLIAARAAVRQVHEEEALTRMNARSQASPAMGGISDYLRMLEQGAVPFGLADELNASLTAAGNRGPGGKGYKEALAESRQRVDDLRLLNPGTSKAVEVGGALLPVAGATGAVRATGGPPSRAMSAGAATGAATGLATGIGASESPGLFGRLRDAIPDAVSGGLFGAVAAPVAAAAGSTIRRMGGNRGQRLARDLERTTGLSRDINARFSAASDATKKVADEVYGKFDDAGVVESGPVVDLYRRFSGKQKANPTFKELQALERSLGKEPQARRELSAAMEEHFEGLADADAAFREAKNAERMLHAGGGKLQKAYPMRTPAEMKRTLLKIEERMPDQLDDFRTGLFYDIVQQLERRDGQAGVAKVQDIMKAGPTIKALMEPLFESKKAANEFWKLAARERRASVLRRELLRLAPYAIGAGVGASAVSAFMRE